MKRWLLPSLLAGALVAVLTVRSNRTPTSTPNSEGAPIQLPAGNEPGDAQPANASATPAAPVQVAPSGERQSAVPPSPEATPLQPAAIAANPAPASPVLANPPAADAARAEAAPVLTGAALAMGRRQQLQPGSEVASPPHPSLIQRAVDVVVEEVEVDGTLVYKPSKEYGSIENENEKLESIKEALTNHTSIASAELLKSFLVEKQGEVKEHILSTAAQLAYDPNVRTLLMSAMSPGETLDLRLLAVHQAAGLDASMLEWLRNDSDPMVRLEVRCILEGEVDEP